MDRTKKYLLDWIIRHLKQRDICFKNITSIDESETRAVIKYKNKAVDVASFPELSVGAIAEILEESKRNKNIIVAVLNTKENIAAMVKNWDEFVNITGLCFYFINPFSKTDAKWIIFPHMHNKISERKHLRQGISSLSQAVNSITDADKKKMM